MGWFVRIRAPMSHSNIIWHTGFFEIRGGDDKYEKVFSNNHGDCSHHFHVAHEIRGSGGLRICKYRRGASAVLFDRQ